MPLKSKNADMDPLFNGNLHFYYFNKCIIVLINFGIVPEINETILYSVKKVAINPKKLEQNRLLKKNETVENLSKSGAVLVNIVRGRKADEAWEFFKILELNGERYEDSKMFCSLCWLNGCIKGFSEQTSLSVLKTHLENIHEKNLKNPKLPAISKTGLVHRHTKDDLVTNTSLMFLMMNIPFNQAENSYFIDWLKRYGVIENIKDAPSSKALSNTGLERLYKSVQDGMIELLKDSPKYIVAVFDCWMDCSKRHFFAIILRFLTSKFQIIELVVAFRCLEYKTADSELKILNDCLQDYQLQEKELIAVSDKGSDMLRLCRLKSIDRLDCCAHGLHNLLNTDVIPKVRSVKELLSKLRKILSAMRYRLSDIKTDFAIEADSQKAKLLLKFSEMGKCLICFKN